MVGFETLIENLRNVEFFTLFLPWLLILAVIYGVLTKSRVLGDQKSVNAVTAVSMAFLVVGGLLYFVPATFFQQFFAIFAVIIVIALGFMITLSLIGVDTEKLGGENGFKWMAVIIVSFVIIFAGASSFTEIAFLSSETMENLVTLFVSLIMVALAVWFITRD